MGKKPRPIVLDFALASRYPLCIIGLISNHEFAFTAHGNEWKMDVSLNVFRSMDTMFPGDADLFSANGVYRGEIIGKENMDENVGMYIISRIADKLCKTAFVPADLNNTPEEGLVPEQSQTDDSKPSEPPSKSEETAEPDTHSSKH